MRYRLQRRERYVMPNILGGHSFPLYTYRWKDIAASNDRQALEDMMPKTNSLYRIEDTWNLESEVEDDA